MQLEPHQVLPLYSGTIANQKASSPEARSHTHERDGWVGHPHRGLLTYPPLSCGGGFRRGAEPNPASGLGRLESLLILPLSSFWGWGGDRGGGHGELSHLQGKKQRPLPRVWHELGIPCAFTCCFLGLTVPSFLPASHPHWVLSSRAVKSLKC